VYVVFIGVPGAGKGTQAAGVAERLGLAHLATGDLLREAVRVGTDLGKKAREYMDKGELVPDSLVVAMVIDRLGTPDSAAGAILDGFPRNLSQAKALEEGLAQNSKAVDAVVFLNVAEPEVVQRLSGRWECSSCRTPYHTVMNPPKAVGVCDRCGGSLVQRVDDTPETVQRRLAVYLEQTQPLLEYYRARGILFEVDGEQPIPRVTDQVLAILSAYGMGSV
jgi:adenylate kinase